MTKPAAPIRVIANAVEFIETLAANGPLSPVDMAERAGIPRSSAYRLIDGLAAISLVEPLSDGRVRLSARWLQLADAAQRALTEWSGASDALEGLVERTGQTAFLSVLVDGVAVCVDWRRGRGVDVLALKPGRVLPLHAGAAGRVMLAYAVDLEEYLAAAPFPAITPYTLVDADALRQDVEKTKEQGYVLSEQDVSIGISAVGVPVFRADDTVAGCLSIGGLSGAFATELSRFVDELGATAKTLAQTDKRRS